MSLVTNKAGTGDVTAPMGMTETAGSISVGVTSVLRMRVRRKEVCVHGLI
jgi:hypothetical protein